MRGDVGGSLRGCGSRAGSSGPRCASVVGGFASGAGLNACAQILERVALVRMTDSSGAHASGEAQLFNLDAVCDTGSA